MTAKILPMEYNVLVRPDRITDTTAGGIIIPPSKNDSDQHAATTGILVAVSVLAFTYDNWPDGSRKPQVGDRVFYDRYRGTLIDPDKPEGLRLIKDKDIQAVITD